MDRQYNDQKKHGQAIQLPKETWTDNTTTKRNMDRQYNSPCFFWSLYCLSMFLLVVVLSVHVSFGSDQKKHGHAIQRPKETWTGNITTKRNMDHVSFGRYIACPCFFWSLYCLSMFLLVVVLSVHVSFRRCIACPCFFWSLYCLSMQPKETWTDNTTTKGSKDRQYNDQKKHGQAIQRPKETWTDNTTTKGNSPCFFWSLYCLSMFLLVVVLSVHVSFGRCIACPCFLSSLYCLSMFLLVVVDRQYNDQKKHGQAIQRPKETWTVNITTKRNMDRQYNYQKKHGQLLYCLSMFLLVVILPVHVSFGRCIVCPFFFW
jgi:hypothetical protein